MNTTVTLLRRLHRHLGALLLLLPLYLSPWCSLLPIVATAFWRLQYINQSTPDKANLSWNRRRNDQRAMHSNNGMVRHRRSQISYLIMIRNITKHYSLKQIYRMEIDFMIMADYHRNGWLTHSSRFLYHRRWHLSKIIRLGIMHL